MTTTDTTDTLRAARERLALPESTLTQGEFALAFARESLDLAEAVEAERQRGEPLDLEIIFALDTFMAAAKAVPK